MITAEQLQKALDNRVHDGSLLIFKGSRADMKQISESLEYFKETFERYNIRTLCCPNDIEIVVVPPGHEVEAKDGR